MRFNVFFLLRDFLEGDASVSGGEPLGRYDSRLLKPLVRLAQLDGRPVSCLVSELGETDKLALQHCGICNDLHQQSLEFIHHGEQASQSALYLPIVQVFSSLRGKWRCESRL